MAAPPETFAALVALLGVSTEAFASPLNATLSRYYSAAPDVDQYFGSLGSFWKAENLEGSLEVNPPFVEEVMECMAAKLEAHLLSHAGLSPLSFCVLVPDWGDCESARALRSSKFLRASCSLRPEEHSWVAGAQHRGHEGLPSKSGSLVFLLQSASQTSAATNAQLKQCFVHTL